MNIPSPKFLPGTLVCFKIMRVYVSSVVACKYDLQRKQWEYKTSEEVGWVPEKGMHLFSDLQNDTSVFFNLPE